MHQPLVLYHEYEQDKERDLLPISNMTILLFIKLYDPKTETLKVSEPEPVHDLQYASCNPTRPDTLV